MPELQHPIAVAIAAVTTAVAIITSYTDEYIKPSSVGDQDRGSDDGTCELSRSKTSTAEGAGSLQSR
jgi:hypothetical protein